MQDLPPGEQVVPEFDLSKVRCSVEKRLLDAVNQNADLSRRLKAVEAEAGKNLQKIKIEMLAEFYRVDARLTPALAHLVETLRTRLRLVEPVDLFLLQTSTVNALSVPSRKGNRLILSLLSGIFNLLSPAEILFVLGHEVGHALLGHCREGPVFPDNDHPDFSPLEIAQLGALSRAQEISADRIGLVACQDARTASTALFKLASGLSDRWVSFDEEAYARQFDELHSLAEVLDLGTETWTHPMFPLRVKALSEFVKSETYAACFGKPGGELPSSDLEKRTANMLSVLDPDQAFKTDEDDGKSEKDFACLSSMLVCSADDAVDFKELDWLVERCKACGTEFRPEDFGRPRFREETLEKLRSLAPRLKRVLSLNRRAELLRTAVDSARCSEGIAPPEVEILSELQKMLEIADEHAARIVQESRAEASPAPGIKVARVQATGAPVTSILDEVLLLSRLPAGVVQNLKKTYGTVVSPDGSPQQALREIVSWAVCLSGPEGGLPESQAKKIILSALSLGPRTSAGAVRKSKGESLAGSLKKFGLVSLFHKGERVQELKTGAPCLVMAVSRSRGSLRIVAVDSPGVFKSVKPYEVVKDPVEGNWPVELPLN